MPEFLSHLIFPRESNNYRAKILHHTSIFLTIIALLILTAVFPLIKKDFPSILGVSTSIKVEELLVLTNAEREKAGIKELKLDPALSQAALKKAENMFQMNYWAHNAPDGTTPWVFIRNAGYNYVYAGENLGRGFSTSQDLVNAWMASESHRANLLSSSFGDVGFAVLTGKLAGEDTVLIVQEFGGQNLIAAEKSEPVETKTLARDIQSIKTFSLPSPSPLIQSANMSRTISLAIVFLFLTVLALDFVKMRNRRIIRVRGHNLDHIMFLLLITYLLLIVGKGVIV
ncbi:MAG: hypothetical protein ACD_37C00549G0001 [uncultured bacterium]|nr:MAG: hypothetical protein ACD_37C00549G0001 [uncultured bacterium]